MRRFETIIDITKPVFIKYHNNVEYKATFNLTDDTWYFTNGLLAAQHFGIKVPAVVYLDYKFHDNKFNMTEGKPDTIVSSIVEQKFISLSSDDDDDDDGESLDEGIGDDEDDGSDDEGNGDQTGGESDDGMTMDDDDDVNDDLYEFDVNVTEAMAYTKQVLVSFKDYYPYLHHLVLFMSPLIYCWKCFIVVIAFPESDIQRSAGEEAILYLSAGLRHGILDKMHNQNLQPQLI
jgi:hypothetical protein